VAAGIDNAKTQNNSSSQILKPGSTATMTSNPNDISHAYQLLQAGQFKVAENICKNILGTDPAHADANNCLGVMHQRL
jgi:hypothetical protein